MRELTGYFLIYATEDGGKFAWSHMTPEDYEVVKRTRRLHDSVSGRVVKPVFIALARVEDAFDFLLEKSEGDGERRDHFVGAA